MAKSCKKGYYYCNTDKKCKKIPKGWHVMPATGRLMRDSEHKNEESKKRLRVQKEWQRKWFKWQWKWEWGV